MYNTKKEAHSYKALKPINSVGYLTNINRQKCTQQYLTNVNRQKCMQMLTQFINLYVWNKAQLNEDKQAAHLKCRNNAMALSGKEMEEDVN